MLNLSIVKKEIAGVTDMDALVAFRDAVTNLVNDKIEELEDVEDEKAWIKDTNKIIDAL